MGGPALVAVLLLVPDQMASGQCDWQELAPLDSYPLGYGYLSAVRDESGLYVATGTGLNRPDSMRNRKILLETQGGPESFASWEIELPYGDYGPYGQVVSDGERIHLLWATHNPHPSTSEEVYFPTTLYWSSFESGTWSRPHAIFKDSRGLDWYPDPAADVAVDSEGTLHVLFPLPLGYGLVYLRKEGDAWIRGEAPRRSASYVDLWAGERDTLYVVVVDAARDLLEGTEDGQGRDSNSVLFAASYDGGASWRNPVLVSRSGTQQASFPDITVSDSGVVHIAWKKNLSGGPFPEVIWTSSSFDGGQTWLEPEQIDYGGGFLGDLDLIEVCDRLNIVFEVFRSREDLDFGVYAVERVGAGWSDPRPIAHGMGYSVTEARDSVTDLLLQTMRNEREVEFAPPNQLVRPETVLRHFQADGGERAGPREPAP